MQGKKWELRSCISAQIAPQTLLFPLLSTRLSICRQRQKTNLCGVQSAYSMPGMLSQASISATFLLLLASLPSSTPTCFLPNGTAHQDEGTSRCSSISGSPLYNTCCQTQWPNPPGGDVINGPTADECMPNGLCQNRGFSSAPGQEAEPWTHFYRVYCANANWEGCLDVCRDGVCCFSPFVAMHVAGWPSFRELTSD